jgi:SAM-dependent methyltransferase
MFNYRPMIREAAEWLKNRLELPDVRGIERDSPALIGIHRRVIERKPFLRALYREHYRELARYLEGTPRGTIVEIGSGGGFVQEVIPQALTTDLHPQPHLNRVMSADRLDFPDHSVAAILMLNVFHHLADPRALLREASRVLRPGGRIVMIEPAHTWLWKRLYRLFSAEPYDEHAKDWGFAPSGRFTGANVPQAWLVFERDRTRFEREFPDLPIRVIRYHTAFLYVLSGGIWFRGLAPPWSFPLFRTLERLMAPAMRLLASQTTVVLQKLEPLK